MPYRPEIFENYPRSDRREHLDRAASLSEEEIKIAKTFGFDYFDGSRRFGLGGYSYNPRFFVPIVRALKAFYGLTPNSAVLDVGCAKGFMLHDLRELIPGITVSGIDISNYAVSQALPSVRPFLRIGSCDDLPYADKSFDLVVSITTIHNLDSAGVEASLREIMRVSRGPAFIRVNGYRTEQERRRLEGWNLVANTILSVSKWEELFDKVGYTGDYDFFSP